MTLPGGLREGDIIETMLGEAAVSLVIREGEWVRARALSDDEIVDVRFDAVKLLRRHAWIGDRLVHYGVNGWQYEVLALNALDGIEVCSLPKRITQANRIGGERGSGLEDWTHLDGVPVAEVRNPAPDDLHLLAHTVRRSAQEQDVLAHAQAMTKVLSESVLGGGHVAPPLAALAWDSRPPGIGPSVVSQVARIRQIIEKHVPRWLTVDAALIAMLGPERLARAIFETDEGVQQFVDSVSDALIGDAPADDKERCILEERRARAMDIAWERNELGARVRSTSLVHRMTNYLRRRS